MQMVYGYDLIYERCYETGRDLIIAADRTSALDPEQ
jgi:hypothetical protein